MSHEIECDVNNLRVGERYTFYINDGDVIRGELDSYLSENGIPRTALRIKNFVRNDEKFSTGILINPINGVIGINRVTQNNIGPAGTGVNRVINSFLGGKRRTGRNKKNKSRKNSKRYRKSRKIKISLGDFSKKCA
jgi:hypothetical protein